MNINRRFVALRGNTVLTISLLLSGLLLPIVFLMSLLLAPQSAWASSAIKKAEQPRRVAQSPAKRSLLAEVPLLIESFDGTTFLPANWGTTVVTGTTQGWSRVISGLASPHSGAGMAQFNSFSIPPGDSTRLYTPLFNLTGQLTPTLKFWMYHDTDYSSSNDRIEVEISVDGGLNYTSVLTTASRYDGSTGWSQYTVDLSTYNGESNVRFGFLAISEFGNNTFIDDVSVTVGGGTAVYLPIVSSAPPPCTPSPAGESNNIADARTICSGQIVTGQVNDNDWDDVYKIFTVAGQTLTISMSGTGVGGPGDADLFLYPPGTTDVNTDPYADSSENDGNNEFIQGTVLIGGYWYIDVFDYMDGDGGTNYRLTATLSSASGAVVRTFEVTGTNQVRQRGSNQSQE